MDIPAPVDSWRLPDYACEVLANLVAEHRPELVVECGSGRSTVVLAEALREVGAGKVVALEHDWEFWHETVELIEERDLFTHAQVRQAALEDGWYARSAWEDLDGIGLLLVDGPPRKTGWEARAPALSLLRDRLLLGAVVVLDDIDRADLYGDVLIELRKGMTIVGDARPRLGYGTFRG
jgi:predicted O-methyltransferase YrrM